jgi:hypothetical protein
MHFQMHFLTGAKPGFQVRGGGALKFFLEVFRVKNHDFTPKKSYFFPILGGGPGGLDPPLPYTFLRLNTWNNNLRV